MALSVWMKTEQFFDSTLSKEEFLKIIPEMPSAVNFKLLFTFNSSTGNAIIFVSFDRIVTSFVMIMSFSSSSSMLNWIVTGSD